MFLCSESNNDQKYILRQQEASIPWEFWYQCVCVFRQSPQMKDIVSECGVLPSNASSQMASVQALVVIRIMSATIRKILRRRATRREGVRWKKLHGWLVSSVRIH